MSVEVLRAMFSATRCRHVLVPEVFPAEAAASLREELGRIELAVFDEPDRGRYELATEPEVPSLFEDMRGLAEQVLERPLAVARATWLRLRHRDYLLLKGDAGTRLGTEHVELTLDFSAEATGHGEMIYTDGYESWPVPQEPGSVTIALREPWVFRYDRYLPHLVGDKLVHRLRLLLT